MKQWNSGIFKQFAIDLSRIIQSYGKKPAKADFDKVQQKQVEEMVAAETAFREALIKSSVGEEVYQRFMDYVLSEKGNILAARPYFRERQVTYRDTIAAAFKAKDPKGLFPYHINYHFIQLAIKTGLLNKGLLKLAKKAELKRQLLIELNMPLALSRVKLFSKNKPAKHLDYMDLVQSAVEGLVAAIDKFVLPYTPVFRSVIIGRVTGQLIKDYSETVLHFYPSDKRKIYRANIARKKAGVTPEQLAEFVNSLEKNDNFTDADEISKLLEAVDHLSLDMPIDAGEDPDDLGEFEAPDDCRPDNQFENEELKYKLYDGISKLNVFQQKLLKLKGLAIK
jgi:DNA-directed RNA polymerase specialized sigma subunit